MERLTRHERAEVIEVLAAAFHEYPVMRYVLRSSGNEYEAHLRDLVGFFCEARFAKGGHVMGIRDGKDLVAVTLIDEAIQKHWPGLQKNLDHLNEQIGADACARLERYETTTGAEEPDAPHYFVGMIGVVPQKQGKGYARTLLEYARKLSTENDQSSGVCLSTEDDENVRFYQHCGYHILSEVDMDELHSWCMFLPTR